MFSFFKKLFNFQKADTKSVKKDKQVELESKDGNTKFEDIKIKDTDSNKRFKANDRSYQRDELNKFNGISSFQSNETAFASSESNVHGNPINTSYKSQRQFSKLATKKITKSADKLYLQSDEEFSDESDNVIDKSSQQKIKSKDEIKLIKKPNKKNMNRKTIRFCQKCETHKTIFGHVTKEKYCDVCGSVLFYVCSYCKEKLYASHHGWYAHEIICNCKNATLNLVDVPNESILHQYSDCNLNMFNEKSSDKFVSFNAIKSGHITGRAKEQDPGDISDERKTEARSEKAHNKKAITVNKQIKMKRFTRYCEKCQKIVKLAGTSNIKNNTKCKTCSSLLRFFCVKCQTQYISNADLVHHFRSKCLSINYKCSECNFHSTNAKSLTLHLKIQHPVIFYCDMCTFQSQFKANLKRHINSIHLQKQLCCQMCSFTTRHLQSLRRHEQSSHLSE